jgi:hypothetical protein
MAFIIVGDKYQGNWEVGFQKGEGVMEYHNGDVYEGNWDNGERNGKGFYVWKSGETYDGDWKDDQMDGRGVLKKRGKEYAVLFEQGTLKEKKTIE